MVRLILTGILLLLLTACGGGVAAPGSKLVKKAIAVQLEQTQQQLSQQLDVDFRELKINHLSITREDFLKIQNLPAYFIQGTYDVSFKLPEQQLRKQHKDFEFYMQVQKEGKTWRLLLPDSSGQDTKPIWRSYLIPR